MMIIEATDRFGRPFAGIVGWLRKHPASVQQLVLRDGSTVAKLKARQRKSPVCCRRRISVN